MKPRRIALFLFGAFVALSLGYVLGLKEKSGTYTVVGAQRSEPLKGQEPRTGEEVEGESPQTSTIPDVSPTPESTVSAQPPVRGDARINVNAATVEELVDLPGIGPVIAQRIVDYREANGPFASGDDLMKVKGIGIAILGDLEEFVRFE